MKAETYKATQDQIFALAGLARMLPVDEFIEAIDNAATLGPFMDPTLYLKGADKMAKIRRIAAAALELKRTADEIFAEEVAIADKQASAQTGNGRG